MSAYLVRQGASIDYTPTSDVTAGTIVVQGSLVGVVNHNIAANTLGSVELEGVYSIDKNASTDTYTVGAPVWINSSKKAITAYASGASFLGVATKASASGDTTVEAKLACCDVYAVTSSVSST